MAHNMSQSLNKTAGTMFRRFWRADRPLSGNLQENVLILEEEVYITDEERKKCQNVAEAFREFYELTDVVVVDAGKYGFVKLQQYKLPAGFDSLVTYTDSQTMFDDLWEDWLYEQLLTPVLGTPVAEFEYEDIFKCLPKEKQKELMAKRIYFKEKSEGKSGEKCG